MPNPHELALEIERFLETPRGRRIEEVRDLATAYAEMCQSANERLRRCADYLRRGLRCEAIYHAEVEPDLLDTVAALDLKWFDQWDTTCEENDLDRPPRLQMEVAEEINEAYTAQQPMQEQLKQLRLLSLARAPLRARLHVLRTLAKKDPNTPMWEEDVRTFEAERIKEMSAEAKQAAKAEDTDWLEDLLKEATRSRWRVPVPPNMVDAVRGLLRRVQTDLAIRKLNALLPDLSDAYSAASYEECAMLLRQWEQIVSADDVPVPEDLAAQIQPIVDWVGQQDYAQYQAPAQDVRAAQAELRALLAVRANEHFEHAWITCVTELAAEPAGQPAVRRFLSQSLDEAALARGLLLRAHWHCPTCGSPGSQWAPGCWQTFCAQAGPVRRAHWDHCRVAARDELLTLMVSEGYERVGALASGAELHSLQAVWHRLLHRVPAPLAADLDRWARDLHDAHTARAAEILELAARLGHAIDLDGDLDPEALLTAAIRAAGFGSTASADACAGKESA